jgi:hypothetical protein
MKIFCLILAILIPLSLYSRYEAYNMEANTKVIYSQQLSTKSKKEIVNVANSGSVIDVSTEQGKNITTFVTGSQDERDAFNAVQAHVLPTLNLLNRINQGKLGATKRVNIQKVKGGRYRITDLVPIDRSSESNKDNYLGRNQKPDASAFFTKPTFIETSPPGTAIPTTTLSSEATAPTTTLGLPPHPASNSNATQESNRSGEATLDVSNAQEAINNALDNPTKSINIGDVYKSVKQQ